MRKGEGSEKKNEAGIQCLNPLSLFFFLSISRAHDLAIHKFTHHPILSLSLSL